MEKYSVFVYFLNKARVCFFLVCFFRERVSRRVGESRGFGFGDAETIEGGLLSGVHLVFWRSAFMVPETAKTCTAASLPATEVIVANEALTEPNVAREVRKTAVFFSKS